MRQRWRGSKPMLPKAVMAPLNAHRFGPSIACARAALCAAGQAWHIVLMADYLPASSLLFDRAVVRSHRDRAAAGLARHDVLVRDVAERLAERVADMRRRFPLALDLGCRGGELAAALHRIGSIGAMVHADLSAAMVARAKRAGAVGAYVVADEELLPFVDARFDLAASLLALHWVNDLPGTLAQIKRCLRPDGLLLVALWGGDTLIELRRALLEAEVEEQSGASPRVAPAIGAAQASELLQRVGFALPVVDVDTITVTYADPFALMRELRGMGEGNALRERSRRFTRRATLRRAAAAYRARHGTAEGRVSATFQVLFLTAWRPHDSQQRPLRPGSARVRLADALDSVEIAAGDKARPR